MTTSTLRVLVALDFSDDSRRALRAALDWAARTPCELHVVHVVEPLHEAQARSEDLETGRMVGTALGLLPAAVRAAVGRVREHVLVGRPATEILGLAKVLDIELLVMGTHGRTGLGRLLLGSVAEHVVRGASCPVLCVKAGADADHDEAPWRRILCPVDFSETSHRAMRAAVDLGRRLGAEVVLLHVYNVPAVGVPQAFLAGGFDLLGSVRAAAEQTLADWKQQAEDGGVTVTTTAILGAPAAEIVNAVAEVRCDLIVIGTHGRTGLGHVLLGSVAEKVVRTATCPVLTIGPERGTKAHGGVRPPGGPPMTGGV